MQDSNINLLSIYDLETFVAIDLETTGLDISSDKIIEVSAVRFVHGKKQEVFSYLLDPGKLISPFIEDLTGISNQMVKGKPEFSDIISNLSDFIGDSPIVGHNVKFDVNFIKLHSDNLINFSKNKIYDTYLLSKIILFSNSEFSLEAITEYYEFSIDKSHRATDDAINSGKILIKLLEDFLKFDISIIDRINNLFSGRSIPNNYAVDSAYKYIKYNKNPSDIDFKSDFTAGFISYHKSSSEKCLDFEDIIGSDGTLYDDNKYQFRDSQYKPIYSSDNSSDIKWQSILIKQ